MPGPRRIVPLVAAVALTAAAAPSGALAARPSTVRCGQQIARDTTLANDLIDCPGTALTVVADGVTLDLGGHLVDGVNAPGSEGVAVDGHAGTRIRNGVVREFRVNGVGLRDAPGSRVRGLTITQIGDGGVEGEDVSAGIFANGSDDVAIDANRVSNDVDAFQADGIVVIASARAQITRNDASANAFNGIALFGSPSARVVRNRTAGNQNSGIIAGDDAGLLVAGNSATDQPNDDTAGITIVVTSGATVVDNDLRDNAAALFAARMTGARVAGNRVRRGGDGLLLLDSDENTVAGNDVADVGGTGVVLASDGEDGSDGNTVAANAVLRSGLAGIGVFDGSHGNVIAANASSANLGTGADGAEAGGIFVDGTDNRLERNVTERNAADGIHVLAPGNRLTANRADRNAGHGIEAADGTIDGGANRAAGNALAPQCIGVLCR